MAVTLVSQKTGEVHEIVGYVMGQPHSLCSTVFPAKSGLYDNLAVTCPRCLAIQSEIS